jgi:hypothetical protein
MLRFVKNRSNSCILVTQQQQFYNFYAATTAIQTSELFQRMIPLFSLNSQTKNKNILRKIDRNYFFILILNQEPILIQEINLDQMNTIKKICNQF